MPITPLISNFRMPGTSTQPFAPTPQMTPGTRVPGTNITFPGQPTGTFQTTPSVPQLGTRAASPSDNLNPAQNNLQTKFQSSNQPAVDTNYFLKPGESIDQYNARIATYNASQNQGGNQTPSAPQPPQPTPQSQLPQVAPPGYSQPNPPQGAAYQQGGIYYDNRGNAIGNIPNVPQGATPVTTPYTPQNLTLPQLLSNTANIASQQNPAFQQAQQQAQGALSALTQSRLNEADALARNFQNPIPLEFQQGRGQVLQNQYLQQQNAYAQQYAGAVAQMGAGTAQQQAQQAGLLGAGGLAAPQLGGITSVPFYPTTGQTGGVLGNTAPGGIAGVTQTLGDIQLGTNYFSNLVPSYNAAGNVLQSFQQWAAGPGQGVNWTDSNMINQLQAWAQGQQFSDPRYPELSQFLNEFTQSLVPIVGSAGQINAFKDQLVTGLINGTSNLNSIVQQAQNLYGLAGTKMNAIQQSFTNPQSLNTPITNQPQNQVTQNSGLTFGSFFG